MGLRCEPVRRARADLWTGCRLYIWAAQLLDAADESGLQPGPRYRVSILRLVAVCRNDRLGRIGAPRGVGGIDAIRRAAVRRAAHFRDTGLCRARPLCRVHGVNCYSAAQLLARRWVWPFCAAVAFAALLFLVKFSSAILVWSALLIFAGALSLQDRRKGARAALLAIVAAPLACAVCYLIYFPSLNALWCYTRLGFEISSGYSSAMSYPSGGQRSATRPLLCR